MTPNWTRADMPVMPKGRYNIMTGYMPKVGTLGLDMMYRTCTVQVNLDFSTKPTWSRKLPCRPGAAADHHRAARQFAIPEGRPSGFLSFRSQVWTDVDEARSGMLPFVFEDGMGFER